MSAGRTFLGVVLTTTVLFAASSGCTKKFPAWLLDRDGGPPPDADLDAEVQPDADDGEVPGCGNGTIDTGETCDDSNTADNDGCSAACQVEAGWDCTGEPSTCTPICGDGLIRGSETCDDQNTNDDDGCSSACQTETGWSCVGEPSVCSPTCGNGQLDAGEACDDNNTAADDGCSASCQVEAGWNCSGEPSTCTPICGDGLIRGSETCDDQDTDDGDGCSSTCQTEAGWSCFGEPSTCAPTCGNGQQDAGEACDDNNINSGDGCSPSCQIETGWTCTAPPSTCTPICGDGLTLGSEFCDDGYTDACGTCNADCTAAGSGSTCGDSVVCPETEFCDDGYTDACGTCNANCTAAGSGSTCGDSVICPETEFCDDGYADACGTCNANCTAAGSGSTCGDSVVCPETEFCDDGYTDACGTCNANCTAAGSGSTCGDSVTCPETEFCDDGYTDACGTCNVDCTAAGSGSTCGDGFTCPEDEFCDDGYADACGTCNADCTAVGNGSSCGDGQTCPETEACDDGDTNDCDGCRGDCSRFDDVCGDGILECGEICDGTNLDGFDCTDFWPPYDWGTLRCDPVTCTFDLSTCYGGDDCTTAGVISDSTTLAHSTDPMTDTFEGNGCGELVWNTDGRDRAYRIELEAGEYMVAWLYPTNWRASIYLTTDCNDIPNSCPEGWRRADVDYGAETLHYATNSAESVYLIVDGSGGAERGDYVLDIIIGTFAIPQNVGDVIITEAMRNPDNVNNDNGEWFEISNTTSVDLLLSGMVVDGDTGEPSFVIDHPLIILAGDYLVFGRNARWDQNGLVNNMSWVYPDTYWLWNTPGVSGDRIGLNFGATLYDEVVWYDNWPGPAGYSMELCMNAYDHVLNDDINNWHDAPLQWDAGNGSDYGSPGVDNNDVGSCP